MSAIQPSAYTWYALVVPSQREATVKTILQRAGFAVFVPERRTFRTRPGRRKGAKITIKAPAMPGYVFLGMSDRTPGWWAALRFEIVLGVLGWGGEPAPLPLDGPSGLGRIMRASETGALSAPSAHRHMERGREFEVGSMVETSAGLYGKVIEMGDENAVILTTILGAERKIIAPLENLDATL